MHPELYPQVFSVQTTHWWGRNRRALCLALIKRFGVAEGCRYLDVGCGTGQNLEFLNSLKPSRVVGIDVSPIALEFARKACSACDLVQSDINGPLPFPDNMFDVATIFNVLYHTWVEDEVAVLKETRRVLKANGILLITEPAFGALAREVDIVDMARRRYRLKPFLNMLQAAAFDVVFSNYFTSFGAPIILGMKAVKALTGKPVADAAPDLRPLNPLFNLTFYAAARIEAGLVKASVPIPFGTTLVCLARKSDL